MIYNESTFYRRPATEGQKMNCPMDPGMIIQSRFTFIDHETMKLQGASDMVPVEELPRHMLLWIGLFYLS